MAFSTIAASDVDSDSPITDTLMNTIRTNFDDHESRILGAEQGGAVALRVVECNVSPADDTWEKLTEVEVWIPAGVTTLSMRCRGKINVTTSWKLRMYIQASSTAGADSATSNSNSYVDVDCSINPDATDKGAWATIEIQGYSTQASRTITMHKDEETIGGFQRNYIGASYWS